MKKTKSLLLLLVLILLLTACGKGDLQQPEPSDSDASGEPGPPATNDSTGNSFSVVNTTWVDLFNGTVMSFDLDGFMSYGTYTGTWSQTDTTVTLEYTVADGYYDDGGAQDAKYTMSFDIIDQDDYKVLKIQPLGKMNGSETKFTLTEYYPESKVEEARAQIAKSAGDTVATDIIELTIKDAELSYYAEGFEIDEYNRIINPETMLKPTENDGFFKSNKGSVLICLDFVVKNTDRATLNTDDDIYEFSIHQGDYLRPVMANELSYGGKLNLYFAAVSENGSTFYKSATRNKLIEANSTTEIKIVGLARFEPEDLSAPFDLLVTLKNSDGGTEQFIFRIDPSK